MTDLIQIIISLIGGGIVGQLINLILNRRKRKTEGIDTYAETIDKLLESNSRLIQEQIRLREHIAKLSAKYPVASFPSSVSKPLYMRRRCHLLKPKAIKENTSNNDADLPIVDAPDEPP